MQQRLTASIRSLWFLLALAGSPAAAQDPPVVADAATVTADGAWCWFADPRAIHWPPGSATILAGWVTGTGDIAGVAIEEDGGRNPFVLHPALQRDDHDNPSFLGLPDGNVLAFYSAHGGPEMFVRRTVAAGDCTAWEPARRLDLNPPAAGEGSWTTSYCYPNPVRLAEEEGRIYLFWRGIQWKPAVAWSDDDGATWSKGRPLFSEAQASPYVRPYLKVASDGRRRIHFAMTDGHPRNEPTNSIRYARYEAGSIRRADGTLVGAFADAPHAPSSLDLVYDGSDEGGRAWIWDVAADADGHPVIVFARLPAEDEHHYHYARWDGERWHSHPICPAGRWFPATPEGKKEPEPHYSGGVVLDPDDPSTIFLSRPVNGVFEIERRRTTDHGATWTTTPVTQRSKANNVRPFVVRDRKAGTPATVMWMHVSGHYRHYQDYATSLRRWSGE